MENELKDIELIENYLDNLLSEEETANFRQKLNDNPDFAKLYDDLKWIIPGIKYTSRNQLRRELLNYSNDLDKFDEYNLPESEFDLEKDFGVFVSEKEPASPLHVSSKNENNTEAPFQSKFFLYSIAASIVILIALTFVFFQTSEPEEAFQLAYNEIGQGAYPFIRENPEDIELNRSSIPQVTADKIQQAYLEYQERNYEEAIKLFEEVRKDDKEKDEKLIFYLGNAYLANNNPQKAIDTFLEITDYNHDYLSKTKWYLGLAFLKNGDLNKAQEVFEDMQENISDSYKDKAIRALEEIKWGIY